MTTPAQKTIAHLRELVKGTTYSADNHIAEIKAIEKQHSKDLIKQVFLNNCVLSDFTDMVMSQCITKARLHSARAESAKNNCGKLPASILSLTMIPK